MNQIPAKVLLVIAVALSNEVLLMPRAIEELTQ